MVKKDLSHLEHAVNQAIVSGAHSQTFAEVTALLQREMATASRADVKQLAELFDRLWGADGGPARGMAPPGPALPPPIGEIFRTVGQPAYTLVEPQQLAELRVRLMNMGEGLVIEGPSGCGKTTLARTGLSEYPQDRQRWISGSNILDVKIVDEVMSKGLAQDSGYLVIDDFHRLDRGRQALVASLMKTIADQNRRDVKVILIGINPVGISLVANLPDLAGRFASLSMTRQPDEKIEELIEKGERAANVRFTRRNLFVKGANGSFIIAQTLCYEAAVKAGVIRAEDPARPPRAIDLTHKDVVDQVVRGLRDKFRPLLLTFAACDEQPAPRGACLALLWQLSRSSDSSVTLTEVRNQYPQLRDSFDWLLASNLASTFDSNPGLEQLLHYNRFTKVLSIEDSRLEYYLQHQDWRELARGSGHAKGLILRFNQKNGPVFAEAGAPRVAEVTRPASSMGLSKSEPAPARWELLHLSDLHFGSDEANATVWAQQLLADLRELKVNNLRALVVSGDIANTAVREQYVEAAAFLQTVCGELKLDPPRVLLTPGNHDLNWALSEDAYTIYRKRSYRGPLGPENSIDKGEYVEVLDEGKYQRRFEPFAAFYRDLLKEDYSLDPKRQMRLLHLPEAQALLLGLNSAWQIDHHYKGRASIHAEALALALREVDRTETYRKSRVKLAVFHHPLSSEEEDRIKDVGFLEQLAQAGFQLVLHGHIHKAQSGLFRYSTTQEIHVLGAGTFGAPRREWRGLPLQYQLLRFAGEELTVETRIRGEVNGAWKPDARWLQGPGKDPLPRYAIRLPAAH